MYTFWNGELIFILTCKDLYFPMKEKHKTKKNLLRSNLKDNDPFFCVTTK